MTPSRGEPVWAKRDLPPAPFVVPVPVADLVFYDRYGGVLHRMPANHARRFSCMVPRSLEAARRFMFDSWLPVAFVAIAWPNGDRLWFRFEGGSLVEFTP